MSAAATTPGEGKVILKIEGLPGEIRGGAWHGCFQIDSFQLGTGRSISMGGGRRGGDGSVADKRTVSNPSFSECTMSAKWNAQWALFAGMQMVPAHFPVASIFTGARPDGSWQSRHEFRSAVPSSFSLSCGRKSEEYQTSLSASLNYSEWVSTTSTPSRKPITSLVSVAGARTTYHGTDCPELGEHCLVLVFDFLEQVDLLSAAGVCKSWLNAASQPLLALQEQHSFSYNLLSNKCSVDRYPSPPLHPTLSQGRGRYGGGSSDDEDAAGEGGEPVLYDYHIADVRNPYNPAWFGGVFV